MRVSQTQGSARAGVRPLPSKVGMQLHKSLRKAERKTPASGRITFLKKCPFQIRGWSHHLAVGMLCRFLLTYHLRREVYSCVQVLGSS